MHFDLTDLRLLSAIATTGSLSRAAATFPVAVSAASTRLRQFEERSGVTLFTRAADGMKLTPPGRLVLEQARQILDQAEQLKDILAELTGQRRTALRLAATTVACSSFLPAALGPFLADYPEVDLQLVEQRSDEILTAVAAGEAELGVYDGNLPTGALSSLRFRDDKLVLLVPRAHTLALRASARYCDALGFPFVCLPPERSMQRFMAEKALTEAMPLKIRVRASSFEAIAQLVSQHAGIAMLPAAAAQRYVRELPVALVALEDPWATRELRIGFKDLNTLSSHARALITYLTPGN